MDPMDDLRVNPEPIEELHLRKLSLPPCSSLFSEFGTHRLANLSKGTPHEICTCQMLWFPRISLGLEKHFAYSVGFLHIALGTCRRVPPRMSWRLHAVFPKGLPMHLPKRNPPKWSKKWCELGPILSEQTKWRS